MTCIAGIARDGKVVIGGDSAGSDGRQMMVRADTKVFRTRNYVMGFTTSFRMGQILRYDSGLPDAPCDDWDLDRFMATKFIDGVRAALSHGGWLGRDSMGREDGGTFLVGVRGALYSVYDDFQIARSTKDYAAVGSGYAEALGSLHTTNLAADWAEFAPTPRQRVEMALLAAADHNAGVSAPFTFEEC